MCNVFEQFILIFDYTVEHRLSETIVDWGCLDNGIFWITDHLRKQRNSDIKHKTVYILNHTSYKYILVSYRK